MCHYAECHYAECHYTECHYAEGHCAESRGTVIEGPVEPFESLNSRWSELNVRRPCSLGKTSWGRA
jgi:hypothetical protein